MWSYVKGLIIGLGLLWLMLFVSLTLSGGFSAAIVFSKVVTLGAFHSLQSITHGWGFWLILLGLAILWFRENAQKRKSPPVDGPFLSRE